MIDKSEAARAEQAAREAAGTNLASFVAYSDALVALVKAAKSADFDLAPHWAKIESYFDLPSFVRYGAFREVTGWAEYKGLISQWAGTTDFWYNFRRVTEAGDRTIWEIEEHNTPVGGEENVCNSLTVAEFNPAGKIRRLDVYLQSEAMMAGHTNWEV